MSRSRKRKDNKVVYIGIAIGFVLVTVLAVVGAFLLGDKPVIKTDPNTVTEQPLPDEEGEALPSDDGDNTGDDDGEVFEAGITGKDKEPKPDKSGKDDEEGKEPEESPEQSGNSEDDTKDNPDKDNSSKDDGTDKGDNTNGGDSSSSEASTEAPANIEYRRPDEMRGVHLVAGKDFLAGDTDAATVQGEIDKAVASAAELDMNTLIVDCFYNDLALHNTQSMPSVTSYDILDMIIKSADASDMYVYAVYDLSKQVKGTGVSTVNAVTTDSINNVTASLDEFSGKYAGLSAVLFTGYYNAETNSSYARYMNSGSGMGYDNYLKGGARSLYSHAVQTVKRNSPGVQTGLLIDTPWADKAEDENGSATVSEFTALYDGNADTKGYVDSNLVDCILVQNHESTANTTQPFEAVASWWNDVAAQNNTPLYIEHASDKACTNETGWTSEDQLMRQLVALQDCTSVQGSAFNSLSALTENPKGSTTAVVAFFGDNVKMDHILKDLVFTTPDAYTKTTFDKEIVVKGASDPTFPLYMDGEEIERDENGYFDIPLTLKPGENIINFKHKDRERTFKITRIVQIIKQVTPEGNMVIDGGMEVSVSVIAYGDAQLSASVGGRTFPLEVDTTAEDEELRGTSYKRFKGTFTAPDSTTSVQNLGQIVIKASWDGLSDTKGGAYVTVNKRVAVGDGVLVRVTAAQAETFPTTRLNNISDPTYYPLPKGTQDYAVGNEITYKDGSNVYTYYKLKSGMRVYSKDITASGGELYENVIKGMRVEATKRYTTVILNTSQSVPYKVNYTGDSIQFAFQYTKTVPTNMSLNKNPLFSSASWSGSTLTLKLAKSGVFLGYKAEYTSDGLVLTFNNPTSLNGARIVVDPGHGVKDKGAAGYNPNYPESVINWEISQKLAAELEGAGATVKLITTRGVAIEPTMEQRLATARAFNPHVYVSVHSNSSKSGAAGSEAYYFYPFAKNLASYASAEMSGALNTTNRGSKYGLFYVTRESQFASVLCETGFLTNQGEYSKLIDSKYQSRVAVGLKNSISSFLKSGNGATGSQSTGNTTSTGTTKPPADEEQQTTTSYTLSLSEKTLSMKEGDTETLDYTLDPKKSNASIDWSSSDKDVATVSSSGKVKAVGEGTATITAYYEKGDTKATCKVTVGGSESSGGKVAVTGIELDSKSEELEVGEKLSLNAEISPSNASNKNIEWSSDDEDVATVSSSGKVTARGEGETAVYAITEDGEFKAKCIIYVTE